MTTSYETRGDDAAGLDDDSVMLAAAQVIYAGRQDQKSGGNRRWQQLKLDYPELAEAVQSAPRNRQLSSRDLDIWRAERDEAERVHREFERWVQSQTSALRRYQYRGDRDSVMADAKSGTPEWCTPHGCWDHSDRGRWARSSGDGPDSSEASAADDSADAEQGHKVRGRDLRTLHVETNGGYCVEGDGSRDNLLEVCRECGAVLDLELDAEGVVVRTTGGQRQYCSNRCYLDRKNRKRRNRRARKSGRRVLSTWHGGQGVPCGQASTGPQELLHDGEREWVTPWTLPCWAADPYLRHWLAGSVPTINVVEATNYRDPTGNMAMRAALDPAYGEALVDESGYAVPVGKVDQETKRYQHSVFDSAFDGMDVYRQHVLAGKP